MNRLINLFVDICLLRAGPQDVPSSGFLFMLTAVLSVVTGTIASIKSFGGFVPALFAQVLDLFLLATFLYIGLSIMRLKARFHRAVTALLGTGVLINLLFMPIELMMGEDPSRSFMAELASILILFLIIWALVVMAHIMRHAFDIRFSGGMLIALVYFLIINWAVVGLLPQA